MILTVRMEEKSVFSFAPISSAFEMTLGVKPSNSQVLMHFEAREGLQKLLKLIVNQTLDNALQR